MEKFKVHIDFDDTLVCSSKRMVEMLNKQFSTNHYWRTIKKYSAKDLFPDATQDDINAVFGSQSFFNKKLKLYEKAEEILLRFEDYFDYEIVTLGIPNNLLYKKKWCEDNLSFKYKFVGLSDFQLKKSPQAIDMSGGVMIDDNTDVLNSTNASYKLLITNGLEVDWNEIHPMKHKNIIPLENWELIGEFLEMNLLGVKKNEKGHINIW